jgi:hypothetical protein
MLNRWKGFQNAEAALYEALMAECKSGIDARVERQDMPGSD